MGHRYYDPSRGRFLTRDPIGYGGGVNLYGYVGNNAANALDPSGHGWKSILAGGVVGIGVGLATMNPFLGIAAGFATGTLVSGLGEGNDLPHAIVDGGAASLFAGEALPYVAVAAAMTVSRLGSTPAFSGVGEMPLARGSSGDTLCVRHHTDPGGLRGIQADGYILPCAGRNLIAVYVDPPPSDRFGET